MSNRNMIEISNALTGKVNGNYDMTIAEMNKLREIFLNEGLFDALSIAFKYGYAMGHKATGAGRYVE